MSCTMNRESHRCPHCSLVQYMTASGNCRRCQKPIIPPAVEVTPEIVETQACMAPPASELQTSLASRILQYRLAAGLSQRALAVRMNVPRTYISKLENGHAMPTVGSLGKIAAALGIHTADFFFATPVFSEGKLSPFALELAEFIPRLDQLQLRSILSLARQLVERGKELAA